MRKIHLLGGAAAAALLSLSSPALASEGGNEGAVDNVDIDYYNDLNAEIDVEVEYDKDVFLWGGVFLGGFVDVDASAVAVVDAKQVLTENDVAFREENFLAGSNGYVDAVFGEGREQDVLAPAYDGDPDGIAGGRGPFTPTGQIEAGYFVPVINDVAALDITGAGNIGANFAAGWNNQQQNVAALATSEFDPGLDADDEDLADEEGGWAEASTMALQSLEDNFYGPNEDLREEDEHNDYRERNTIAGGNVDGDGNIGVNAAAGAFNQQQNLLSVAVVSEASLAEANAGVFQNAFWNDTTAVDINNYVGTVVIAGAGNIGVNAASGVGNQQHNSLTIAASTPGGTDSNGGGTGGGGGVGS